MIILYLFLLPGVIIFQGCGPGKKGSEEVAKLIKLDLKKFPAALCLDGSAGAYYFRRASSTNSTKRWVISLEGGGECTQNETCYHRSSSRLGSSKSYADTEKLVQFVHTDSNKNPLYDWNHVRIKYCSGDLYMGSKESREWTWGAHFRGADIFRAVVQNLVTTQNLTLATAIVLTGESAGGIGVFMHLDSLKSNFSNATVVGAPIAGYYWNNTENYTGEGHLNVDVNFSADAFKHYQELWGARLPKRCTEQEKNRTWVCALPQYAFKTLESPVFVIEAQVDYIQLQWHSGANCANNDSFYNAERAFCKNWGYRMQKELGQVENCAKKDPLKAGMFSPACRLHGEFDSEHPKIGNQSYTQAFWKWFEPVLANKKGPPVVLKDDCCSNVSTPDIMYNPTCPQFQKKLKAIKLITI